MFEMVIKTVRMEFDSPRSGFTAGASIRTVHPNHARFGPRAGKAVHRVVREGAHPLDDENPAYVEEEFARHKRKGAERDD